MIHSLNRLLVVLCLLTSPLRLNANDAEEARRVLFAAAASGDLSYLQRVLPGVDPDTRNENDQTALMIAAQNGHFDAARFLLWQGADANLKDADGRTAQRYLMPGNNGFAPLNLLLRCYAFTQENGEAAGPVKQPNLVIINDNFVDFEHPDLKEFYRSNEAELGGTSGKDDDGNGFTDDLHGWNVNEDKPVQIPLFKLLRKDEHIPRIEKILEAYETQSQSRVAMSESYDNPLVAETGFEILMDVDIDANDLLFVNMLKSASHGTHVAGIIVENSAETALLHTMAHGRRLKPKEKEWDDYDYITTLASQSDTYTEFVAAIRNRILTEAYKTGKRSSAYLQSTGAGIINMSYGKSKAYFIGLAERIQSVYENRGKNPDSMELHACPIGVDLCSDLALELLVADAASFALMIHENPDLLFVMSAGNAGENTDLSLPSPGYLSRFFPNAVTVASVDAFDQLSDFSNYGLRSVQIAAPGEGVRSTILGGFHARMGGTSMATPAVSGVAAQIRAAFPSLSAAEVRRILERSGRPVPALRDKVHSGSILNSKEAMNLASSWIPGLEPLNEFELKRVSTLAPLPDGPDIEIPGTHPGRLVKPVSSNDDYSSTSWRVTSLGGFGDDSWRAILSRESGFKAQLMIPAMEEPWELLTEGYRKDYLITSLAGDAGGWAAMMSSDRRDQEQTLVPYDQTLLKEHMDQGYAITSLAGWKDSWLFVLTTGSGLGDQRYSLPSDFDQNRKEWINARFREGYRITDIAGDDTDEDNPGTWVIVMSKSSAHGDQVYRGIGPWPTKWIRENTKKGYRVTNFSGYADRWVVVMSKGTGLGQQMVSPTGDWPMDWVEEQW